MRLDEKLTFYPDEGGSIEFSPSSNYFWKEQDGMGRLFADIYTSQKAGRSGVTITGKHTAHRVITVTAQINKLKVSVDAARETLLRTVRVEMSGILVYENSLFTRYIPCVVQASPDPNLDIFAEFDIEFFCASPFWRKGDGTSKTVTTIAAVEDNIEFPLEIPEEGLEFSYQTDSLLVNIVNDGDREIPLTIQIKARSSVSDPTIINVVTQEYFIIEYDMLAGDVITIETDDDLLSATLLRDGVETNVFNSVPEVATWLKLARGSNYLRGDASSTDNVTFELSYDDGLYGGV